MHDHTLEEHVKTLRELFGFPRPHPKSKEVYLFTLYLITV
jgi:hypothetical protein